MKVMVTCDMCNQTKHQAARFRVVNARTGEYSRFCKSCERDAKGSDRLKKVQARQVEKPANLLGQLSAKLVMLAEDEPRTVRELANETGSHVKNVAAALRTMTDKGYFDKDDTYYFQPTYLATSQGVSIARDSLAYYGAEVKKTYQSTNPWDWRTFRAPGASQRPLGF